MFEKAKSKKKGLSNQLKPSNVHSWSNKMSKREKRAMVRSRDMAAGPSARKSECLESNPRKGWIVPHFGQ